MALIGSRLPLPVKGVAVAPNAALSASAPAAAVFATLIVALTVGSDGRVSACRVQQPSGDPDADAITCRLAIERFRFRPARNAAGAAVEAVYGWQQRFFAP